MKIKQKFSTKNILLVLFGVLFISLALHQIINTDIFFHIRCGQDMLDSGRILTRNVYSFAAEHYEFSNHAWIAKVLFALVYNISGIYGINIFGMILLCFLFLNIFLMLIRTKHFAFYYFVTVIGLVLISPRFQVRPQLFSFLFFTVYLQIMFAYVNNRRKELIYLLIPLQYIWNNTHAYSILGIFVVGCFFCEEFSRAIVRYRLRKRKNGFLKFFFQKKRKGIFLTFFGVFLTYAVLYRVDLFIRMYIQLFTVYRSFCFFAIEEFLPIRGLAELTLYIIFVLLTLPFIIRLKRNGDYACVIIYSALLLLSLMVSRNIGYFIIAGLTILGYRLTKSKGTGMLLKALNSMQKRYKILKGGLVFLACILIISQLVFAQTQITGLGVHPYAIPVSIGEYFEKHPLEGNGYNEFAMGSYLIYKFYPQKKVLIHNQVEAYPPKFLDDYIKAYNNKNVMTDIMNKHKISYAIVKYREQGKRMIEWFSESEGWKLIYCDGLFFIFVRNNVANAKLIEEQEIIDEIASVSVDGVQEILNAFEESSSFEKTINAIFNFSTFKYTRSNQELPLLYNRANAFVDLGQFNRAEKYLLEALQMASSGEAIMSRLCSIYAATRDAGKVNMLYEYIKKHYEHNKILLYECVKALINVNEIEKGRKLLLELQSRGFNKYEIKKTMGDISLLCGKFDEAESYYKEAVARDRKNPEVYARLGKLYILMQDYGNAMLTLEEFIALEKSAFSEMLVLASVYMGLGMKEEAKDLCNTVLSYDRFNEKARTILKEK
ncbi:tetratricopeptide repeat protein [Candidatus Omnitrophota bacterium]